MVTACSIRSTKQGASGTGVLGHVPRKFYDLQVAHKSPAAAEALARTGALYAIEKEIQGRFPEERCWIRDIRSGSLLGALKQWLEETLGKLSRKSDTAVTVRYGTGAMGSADALLRRWAVGNR
jgi:hypothetical protein